eukprot:3465756-Prorocentrum_lima.AAC.1
MEPRRIAGGADGLATSTTARSAARSAAVIGGAGGSGGNCARGNGAKLAPAPRGGAAAAAGEPR